MKRTRQQNKILYTLLAQKKIELDHKAALVSAFTDGRTEKSSEMDYDECQAMIDYLSCGEAPEETIYDSFSDLDKKRKQVIAAIFRYCELLGKEVTMEYVKGIACRAADVKNFNKISGVALTRIYNEFCRKQKVITVKNAVGANDNLPSKNGDNLPSKTAIMYIPININNNQQYLN